MPVNVEVNESTAAPTVLNNGPICIDAPGASLVLSVSPATAIPGAVYTWYDALTNSPVAGPAAALTTTLSDFTAYGEGIFDFYVIAEVNGCASASSIPTSVVMNTIPDAAAFAGPPTSLCNATTASLAAQTPAMGTGVWTQIAGPPASIADPTAANSVISGLQTGEVYTFLWTLSNGACTNYSSDQVTVTVDGTNEQADAGLNQELCNATSAVLAAVPSAFGATGTWSQSAAQQALGVLIANPTDLNTGVSGLEAGMLYEFTWTLSNPGCGDFSSAIITILVEESEAVAFAGLDFEACADGVIQLDADDPASGLGTWTTTDPNLTIIEPNNPSTLVQGFSASGTYTFTWTLDNAACGITSDEVTVTYEAAPIAVDDNVEVPFAETVEINVKVNDDITAPFTATIAELPANGQLVMVAPGEFVYSASPIYAGEDEFSYTLCSQTCPDVCSSAVVRLNIGTDVDCNIPTIFTPNNDQVNDYFIIPCLATEDYPDNVVSIFNQWGDEVFRSAPYQNDWRGTYKGEDLPVGTYYFVISFGSGQEPKAGFLVLER